MSIYIAGNFIKKRGMDSLLNFQDMLNKGKKLYDIASVLHISGARTNVLRDQLFIKRYHFKPHVQSFLQAQININEFNNSELKKRLGECENTKVIKFDDAERKIHLR